MPSGDSTSVTFDVEVVNPCKTETITFSQISAQTLTIFESNYSENIVAAIDPNCGNLSFVISPDLSPVVVLDAVNSQEIGRAHV